jgi:hypothetical protein
LWPDAERKPLVATLNALDGAITSNMAIVPTLNGSIDAYASNATDLVLDIFSYFAPITSLGITTTALPSATLTYNYNTTLGASGGVTPYNWSITSGSLPPGLNLDAPSGLISGMPTMVGTYPFTVQVADSQSPPATVSVPLGISVNATLTPLTVVTTSLAQGTQNTIYSAMLAATGGITPYTWSISTGSLPNGLSLNSGTGAITGTPIGVGTSNFTVQVADSQSPPATATGQLSITIAPAVPLSITTTSLPSGTAGSPYNATVAAIGGVTPYTWSVISGKMPDGLTLNSSTGAITGTPQNVGTSNLTFQVTDSETPPVTATAQLSIVVKYPGGGGDPGLLRGNYAFFLNGFNFETGAWTMAGSFISDGAGNITSGVLDTDSVAAQPFNTTITGTYSIATTGLNTLTIQGQSWGPTTFAFVLDSTGNGRMIEYDDTTGQGNRGSGALRKQDPTAFVLSKLDGNWVFGSTGANYLGQRFVVVGQSTLAGGNISNGTIDYNEGGTYGTATFTGTISTVDPQTGRATGTTQTGQDTSPQVFYVVSTGELIIEQIESHHPNAGSVLQQSGWFSNASLNGAAVLYYQDIHAAEGADQSGAMIINFQGNGNGNVVATDEDLAGTITQKAPGQANYSVAANGALTFLGGNGVPAGFLISQNRAFFVGTGANSIFGAMEPQTGGPFSNASMQGTYAAGSLVPLDYPSAHNQVMVGPADGQGTLTLGGDSSGSQGIDQFLGTVVTYNIATNGRGTGEALGDTTPSIVYMISPTRWIVLLAGNPDAGIALFEH